MRSDKVKAKNCDQPFAGKIHYCRVLVMLKYCSSQPNRTFSEIDRLISTCKIMWMEIRTVVRRLVCGIRWLWRDLHVSYDNCCRVLKGVTATLIWTIRMLFYTKSRFSPKLLQLLLTLDAWRSGTLLSSACGRNNAVANRPHSDCTNLPHGELVLALCHCNRPLLRILISWILVSGLFYKTGDSMRRQYGYKFTTYDNDNDISVENCAVKFHGAWWYERCHASNLNGLYLHGSHTSFADGIEWNTWTGYYYSLRFVEMKIRPVDFWVVSFDRLGRRRLRCVTSFRRILLFGILDRT